MHTHMHKRAHRHPQTHTHKKHTHNHENTHSQTRTVQVYPRYIDTQAARVVLKIYCSYIYPKTFPNTQLYVRRGLSGDSSSFRSLYLQAAIRVFDVPTFRSLPLQPVSCFKSSETPTVTLCLKLHWSSSDLNSVPTRACPESKRYVSFALFASPWRSRWGDIERKRDREHLVYTMCM